MTEQPSVSEQVDGARDHARSIRIAALAVVWLAGLAAGFYALLSIAVRYGCGANNDALACTGTGSSVGALIVFAVIGVVTATTVLALNRTTRGVFVLAGIGILGLLLCFIAAKMLLDTV